MNVMAIIPARGGSKGLPNKNIITLNGKPLIAYTIEAAKRSRYINRVLVSTDDKKIARVAQRWGAEVPFMRPARFASDKAPMIDVVRHATQWLVKNEKYNPDAVVLLQPTSPLRSAQSIDRAIKLFVSSQAKTLVSTVDVPHQFLPASLMKKNKSGFLVPFQKGKMILRRQDKRPLFARNGPAILIIKPLTSTARSLYNGPIIGFSMSSYESIDIDHHEDLAWAALLLKNKKRFE